jgi:hypothetical protein
MAITIDWATLVINVPKADTQLVSAGPPEIRALDIDVFRLTLKDLEDDEDGVVFLHTHNHNPPVTVGGVTLARVIEIINGYTITFEDGQYAVNLVGANSNIADVANVNQVSIRSANSAGLTFSEQINDQSFAGSVNLDVAQGLSGTLFPRGTQTDPVNNFPDADIIASSRRLTKIILHGTLVAIPSYDLGNYAIEGVNILDATVALAGAPCVNTAYENLALGGTQGVGFTVIRECITESITNFEGAMVDCVLNGSTYTLVDTPASLLDISFFDCVSGTPGANSPIIDVNGCSSGIQIRRYAGGIQLQNITAGNCISIDLTSGTVTLHASCTSGVVVIRGVGKLIDNSGVGLTVDSSGLIMAEDVVLSRKLSQNKFVTDSSTGVATLYDDDGVTVLLSGSLYEDADGTQAYRGRGAERRERLE